ncbi:MAG: hypothetical protein LBE90_18725 [Pantoea dispersa]|nr:hypothetical protein [Pantoea dispersa]MBZ6392519.1 hypothetical protein [Pantoea dispersa]
MMAVTRYMKVDSSYSGASFNLAVKFVIAHLQYNAYGMVFFISDERFIIRWSESPGLRRQSDTKYRDKVFTFMCASI